jgi:hypothetical protein
MGRMEEDGDRAVGYFGKALHSFTTCHHYRGIYSSLHSLHCHTSPPNLDLYHVTKRKY